MKQFLIDGNNLLFKIKKLDKLVKKDRQSAREKLAFMIDDYFSAKGNSVIIYFDGYENVQIKVTKAKIIYAENQNADSKIKRQIESSKNPKNLVIVSSDIKDIIDYAKKFGCEILSSEKFSELLTSHFNKSNGDEKLRAGISVSESKKWFNI